MRGIMGVAGYPIGHTLSPAMHEAAFKELGLNMAYHAFEVRLENLSDAVKGIRGLGLKGMNVTIPHKVEVMNYLDEIDNLAAEIGAVNTIVNRDGRLKGYNTDGEGYFQSLREAAGSSLEDKRVLVIGSGGAARAVAVTIAKNGVGELVITNRTLQKSENLAETCLKFANTTVLPMGRAQARLTEFDVIINTTSVGMYPETGSMPMSMEMLSRGTIVSDLIYNPLKTRWLKEAEKRGGIALNGVNMFVYQGAIAFKLWTGVEAPIRVMREAVLRNLKGE
ncbi:shikimate dehydrogenase [Evansella clarkii]|uniref:shikimate dehydrogenase n=1 Tax=Evansella clarkii TaxID=79879 RepID=UPI0009980DE4|nr:shikimate dehydrogenase [Evansella clarkii]